MKVKCKICGKKGFWELKQITEYYSGNFIMISRGFMRNYNYICRDCLARILQSLQRKPSLRIIGESNSSEYIETFADRLKPEIELVLIKTEPLPKPTFSLKLTG